MHRHSKSKYLAIALFVCQHIGSNVVAQKNSGEAAPAPLTTVGCRLLTADRLFDGLVLRSNAAVIIANGIVAAVGTPDEVRGKCDRITNLGDATILPGFIESHAHLSKGGIPGDVVLRHGVTTVLDLGGPLAAASGGNGTLRVLSAGPIIQAPSGYPLNVMGVGSGGYDQVGLSVETPDEAREVVQHLVDGGAAIIKISLERGGQSGAPWMQGHSQHAAPNMPSRHAAPNAHSQHAASNMHSQHAAPNAHSQHAAPNMRSQHAAPEVPWPILSSSVVKAIVEKAHLLGKRTTAHVGDNVGVQVALDGGVDEWAHVPCAEIDEALLRRAVKQGVSVVTTLDTLSSCTGIRPNAIKLAALGAHFLYGSEIAHNDVPWGINAEELQLMLHLTGMRPLELLQSATSKAGAKLGVPLLGTLSPGAPADLIAVRGNPLERLKLLEYPDLVISGGRVVLDNFHD